jgi:hypothetical protein
VSTKEVSTNVLIRAFGWTTQEQFTQQDVQEMMRVLLDKLEENMKGTVVDGVVKYLFCGKERSFIRCLNVDYESKRTQEFYDIQLDVRGCKNVIESFRKYTAKETLDGENQYDAEKFGKQDAEKGVIFTHLPPVLTIHLKRFDYDMNFGFVKVHDRYEFPVRLCLDEFVVQDEDAPENPGRGNTYLLHSVLVHAGDVGGGHYYAFIQPRVADNVFRAADLTNANHPGGQWYKFNDEIVLQVSAREAIENCFGANAGNKFSSAYMLVYINEADVVNVMPPIVDTDIPVSLTRRLKLESWSRELQGRIRTMEKSCATYRYFTDDDVAIFRKYTRLTDFVAPTECPVVKIPVDSSYVKLLTELSNLLRVNPAKLRIWSCHRRRYEFDRGQNVSVWRVGDPLQPGKIANMDDGMFYVQIVPDSELREDFSEYVEAYNEFKERENEWIKRVLSSGGNDRNGHHETRQEIMEWRDELLQQSGGPEISDVAVGGADVNLRMINTCLDMEQQLAQSEQLGVGVPVKYLSKLVPADQVPALREDLKQLASDMTQFLRDYGPRDISVDDERLLFIRVYDPEDMLPHWEGKTTHTHHLVDANGDITETASLSSTTSCSTLDEFDSSPENPLKYIGSCVVPRIIRTRVFEGLVRAYMSEHLMKTKRYEKVPVSLEEFIGEYRQEILGNSMSIEAATRPGRTRLPAWRIFGCGHMEDVEPSSDDDESDSGNNVDAEAEADDDDTDADKRTKNKREPNDFESGDVIVFETKPTLDAQKWLHRKAYVRHFNFIPADTIDRDIANMMYERITGMETSSTSSSNSGGPIPRNNSTTFAGGEGGNNSGIHNDSAVAVGMKRNRSSLEALNAAAGAAAVATGNSEDPKASSALDRSSDTGDSNKEDHSRFVVDEAPSSRISILFEHFQDLFRIPPAYVMFHSTPNMMGRDRDLDTIHCNYDNSISDCVSIPSQAQNKPIPVRYKFTPLPVLQEAAAGPGINTNDGNSLRYLEILVTDVRLRKWRKHYLQQMMRNNVPLMIAKLLGSEDEENGVQEAADAGDVGIGIDVDSLGGPYEDHNGEDRNHTVNGKSSNKRKRREQDAAADDDEYSAAFIDTNVGLNETRDCLEPFLSESKVYMRFDKESTVGQMMVTLRGLLGLPKNMNSYGAVVNEVPEPTPMNVPQQLLETEGDQYSPQWFNYSSEPYCSSGNGEVACPPVYPIILFGVSRGIPHAIAHFNTLVSVLPQTW